MKFFLLGVKHSGKTTVGKILSKFSGYNFYDTDKEIEKKNNLTSREIYKSKGKDFFVKEEASVCKEISLLQDDLIISTGGGISDNPEALKILKDSGILIFLDMPFKVVWNRILNKSKTSGSLPGFLTSESPEKQFFEIYNLRKEIYKSISDFTYSCQENEEIPDCDTIAKFIYEKIIKQSSWFNTR